MTKIKARRIAYYAGMAVVPAGIGALVGKAKRSTLAGSVAGGLTALAMLGVRWQLARLFTEEPDYEIEDTVGPLEIRRYFPQITAHTRVDVPSYDAALQQGFRRLARYIFGDNFIGGAHSEKLAMTSPVITTQGPRGYEMSFMMPSGRALTSLPTPNDSAVELDEVPERRVAVLKFRGSYRGSAVDQHERELLELVKAAGLRATSVPMFAGFDPPTTLPFLRRNEMWVEVEPHS